MLFQPSCQARNAVFQIDFWCPAQLSFCQRDVQRIAIPVGCDFGGVRVLADFKLQIRQRFLNRALQIFTHVRLIKADIVSAAEWLVGKQSPADGIYDIIDIDQVIERAGEKRPAGLAEDAFF